MKVEIKKNNKYYVGDLVDFKCSEKGYKIFLLYENKIKIFKSINYIKFINTTNEPDDLNESDIIEQLSSLNYQIPNKMEFICNIMNI